MSNAIAEIEEWSHQETVRTGWPSDAVRFYDAAVQRGKIQRIVHQEMTLVKVDTPISGSIFVGILDAVRTRILDLALELEKVAPTAGQPDMGPGVAETAAQVVNTYNFYGTSSVAINSRDVSQTIHAPEQGDENGLLRFLAAGGVSLELLSALQIALAADREEERANGEPGRWARTRAWFRRASTDAGSNALGNLLSTAAVAFFGS